MGLLELAPPKVRLKPEQALQRFGILAMSGAGKSNTAVVMAEELFENFVPWVAIDPKGDWWGIRSSTDGNGPGLAVPVFGGLHGDLPLLETAGKEVAELIADTRLTCILDVSEFSSKAAQLRFLTDFAETLLKKNRDPLMVFCEEADDYLPQRVMAAEAKCVGAWTKLVKRGRFRGVFVTLISQRSAALNKDALNQIDTLIPMRITAPRDRKAIEEWVMAHGIGKELIDSLNSLEDGEGWLWSPQKLKLMERLRFRRRKTYDSGETPTLKGSRPAAKLADVDLAAVEEKMAKAVEKAKQEDPEELRKEIAKLRKELGKAQGQPKEVEVPVEVPVFPDELKERVIGLLTPLATSAAGLIEEVRTGKFDPASSGLATGKPQTKIRRPPPPTPKPERASGVGSELPRGAEKMLLTLVQRYPMKLSRSQLATLSGYSVKSSTVSSSLTALRNAGVIEEGNGLFWPSEAGFAEIGDAPDPPAPGELVHTWQEALSGGARAFFEELVNTHPNPISRAELADRAGYSINSSTVSSSLTTLRRNGLLNENGDGIALVDEVFA